MPEQLRTWGVWVALAGAILAPILIAAQSPLLAWREPVYIIAGFAGIVALALLLLQPLLAAGLLPNVALAKTRLAHRWVGPLLLVAVIAHVGGLWLTSPPDVIDALLFVSPTPFSAWGVIAMWAIFATAVLGALRPRFRGRLWVWRLAHTGLAIVIVGGTVVHALLIEGTMGPVSKVVLCGLAGGALLKAILNLRTANLLRRARP